MHIANPIYDVVFKYLMEDEESAKLLISAIISQEVISLKLEPKETVKKLGEPSLLICRMDFAVKIKTQKGEKLLLIEMQKAKLPSDIMRFRRYLGEQYGNEKNVYSLEKEGKTSESALPILTI
jgi:hypothetical protein